MFRCRSVCKNDRKMGYDEYCYKGEMVGYIFEFDSVRLQPYSNRIGINRKKTMGFS